MALAVDTAGKVKANPTTGKVGGGLLPEVGGGASALRDAVGGNALASESKESKRNTLADVARRAVDELKHKASIEPVSTPRTTSTSTSVSDRQSSYSPQFGQLVSSQPVGLSGSSGMIPKHATNSASGASLDDEENGADWERSAAEREGRKERTENYFGEQYEKGGQGVSGYMGNTQTNDAYLRNAVANGLSDDDAWAILHRPNSIDEENQLRSTRNVTDGIYDGVGTTIDDGTRYDYAHMTSEWMTGPQYKRYVEMGMGGRPVDQIDPTQVYSKVDEAKEHNFIPFVPDMSTDLTLAVGDVFRVPGELGNRVAGARTSLLPDYSITYGPDGTTISGKDFDRLAPTFLNNYYYNLRQDPNYYLTDHGGSSIQSVRQYSIPTSDGGMTYAYGNIVGSGYDDTFHMTFSDGQQVDVTQEEMSSWPLDSEGLRVIPDEYFERHGDLVDSGYDDTLYLTFSDGQTVGLSPDYIAENVDDDGMIDLSGLESVVDVDEARGSVPGSLSSLGDGSVYYTPTLVMPDGTEIPVDDVERLYWDETAGDDEDKVDEYGNVMTDDDIVYDFGSYGLGPVSISNKPRRLMSQEPITISPDGVRWNAGDELLTDAVDWSLGSLPISVGTVLPWVYSVSQAPTALYGVNSGSYNPSTGSYGLSAGGWDDDGNLRYGVQDANGNIDQEASDTTRWWNALGTAAVPLTEQLVGPVGSHIIPLEGLTSKIPFKSYLGKHIADTLVGAAAEGVEEDLGNIFDELMQYGPSGAFANPVMRDGEVVRDMYGHEVRDPEGTTALQRVTGFLDPTDLANSFLGGAAVSGLLGSPQFIGGLRPSIMADRARLTSGVDKYAETDLEREVREALEERRAPNLPEPRRVSERYASQFDDYRGDR